MSSDVSLPKGLQHLLAAIVDRELVGRLTRVSVGAAKCIEQLQAINLVSLEPSSADEGSADLSLWEQMAPAIADTVAYVNGLCAIIDLEFTAESSRSGVFSSDTSDERAEAEAALVFRAVARHLRREVAQVGTMMRRPELLSSRWALLEELQRLRADFRRRVGDAVYLASAAITPVRREDVVPQASQEVQRAVLYRTTAADLIRQVRGRLAKDEAVPRLVAALQSDLDLFSTMPAWRHVHAGPKRHLLMVKDLLARDGLERAGVHEAIESALGVLDEVSVELTRDVLSSHDLQAFSDARFRLEQARLHARLETGAASWAFNTALAAAERLKGRDRQLDAFLRKVRKDPYDENSGADLIAAIDELQDLLRPLVG